MNYKRFAAYLISICVILSCFSGCSKESSGRFDLRVTGKMELGYATQFSVEYCEGGYKLISLGDGSKFLTVPEGKEIPDDLDKNIKPICQPVKNIYLAATSAMCLFDSLEALDAIRLSGTKEDGWYIENARNAMKEGRIIYAGKYSEPDYELLLSESCPLAIESTMIGHASEIKDQLERLGISVLVDQSSNEAHPLGRAEWIKLYGALLDKEEKAEQTFKEQSEILNAVSNKGDTGVSAAFFYISTTGRVIARRSGDYVSKMIELAGGHYVFDSLGDPSSKMSTVTLEMESFYKTAKDADVIIYNCTIGDEIETLDELLQKNSLLSDFKAVKTGRVWCTGKNMYQETTALGEMIRSFHLIFEDTDGLLTEVTFFTRLK